MSLTLVLLGSCCRCNVILTHCSVCVCHADHLDDSEEENEREALLLTVEALKAQLEEQTRLCKEQVCTEYLFYLTTGMHACIMILTGLVHV